MYKKIDEINGEFNETVGAMLAEIQRQAAEIARLRMEKSELRLLWPRRKKASHTMTTRTPRPPTARYPAVCVKRRAESRQTSIKNQAAKRAVPESRTRQERHHHKNVPKCCDKCGSTKIKNVKVKTKQVTDITVEPEFVTRGVYPTLKSSLEPCSSCKRLGC